MKGIRNLRIIATVFCIGFVSSTTAQPVIQSIYPPALAQRSGEHAAFLVTATGGGTLTYQWYFGSSPLAGQTKSSLVLTNLQVANSGTYGVTVTDSTAQSVSNSVTLNVSGAGYMALLPGNLVVVRVGDGAQALSHANGNTVFLDQYTPSGVYVSTVMVPDEAAGAPYSAGSSTSIGTTPALLVDGAGTDSPFEALMTLSANQQFLCFAGYCVSYPFTNSANDVTSSGGNGGNRWRGMGTVNAFGLYSLAYTNTGLYSGGNHTIRGVVSSDGVTNFWTTGQAGSPGLKYVNKTNSIYANGAGIPQVASGNASTRVVQIVGTNLVFSDWAGASGAGLYACAGTPTPAANAATTPSALILAEGGHPLDFAASPDLLTVYIADDQTFGGANVQAGGVQRWDTTTPGSGYTYSYTLPANAGTAGARGVTVDFSANTTWGPGVTGAIVYITSADATPNTLSRVLDNGSGSTATVLVTAGTGELLRGVRFSPVAAPVGIASQPQSQTNFPGNNATFTVTASGSAPYFYQWQFNGSDIVGASSSSLTLTNIQLASAGNYTVIVSNLVPSAITSSVAVLTVTLGKPAIVTGARNYNGNVGDHFALTPVIVGSTPIIYQWYFNDFGTPIAGATNVNLVLTNVQSSASARYFVVATNIFGAVTNSASVLIGALQTLSSNNLIVARIGDGVQPLSGATGNTLYLEQYSTGGLYLSTTMVPDEGNGQPYGTGGGASTNMPFGSPALIFAGAGNDAANGALLTLSGDTQTINFAGYCLAYPCTTADVTAEPTSNGGNIWRGLAGVNAFGFYSMEYTNTGLYSGGNHSIRSMVTSDGTNFWTTGQAGANGVKYANSTVTSYANGAGIPVVTSSAAGSRVAQIINGNLIFSDISGTSNGLYMCAGLPQPAANGTALSSLLLLENGSPMDFAFSPDMATVYISDTGAFGGTNVQSGGIQRWDTNALSGGYTYNYTLGTGTNSTVGARGLTVSFPGTIPIWGSGITGAILFATTSEASGNRLIKITDSGPDSSAQVLVTAGLNQVLSGVRFGPTAAPATIARDPQNQIVPAGSNAVFTVLTPARSGPYTYQWYEGATVLADGPTGSGSTIAGSHTASLLISNVSAADCGNYFVVAANPLNSATSVVAQLDLAIIITNQPASLVIPTGSTAVFTVGAIGNGTLHYQWLFNGSPLSDGGNISGSTTTTLTINNAQLANVGTYSAAITDDFIAATNSQIAYLEIGAAGSGTGLLGQYWSNQHETPNASGVFAGAPTLTRIDPTINFTFGTGSPDPTISTDFFAVIWSGQVQPFYTDNYTFTATTDDGVRLWVNGQLLIDQWINHGAAPWLGTISLNANQMYTIVMEYYENTGGAVAQLSWAGNTQPAQIVPQSQLYSYSGPTFTVQPTNAVTVQENDTLVLDGGTIVGTAPFSYQWYASGSPIAGQTGATLVLNNIPGSLSGATLTLVATNLYGAATNAGTLLTVQTGPPVITSDIQPPSLTALVGMPVNFTVAVSGTLPNYQWKYNGVDLADSSRIFGSHSNVLSIVQALQSDAGTYQLFMTNSFGNNQSAVANLSVTRIALNNGDGWSLQSTNSPTFIQNNLFQLTSSGNNEASAAFVTFPMYIGAFRASWTYQESPGAGAADGACFVLQNSAAGPAALGAAGGNLGYAGITNSAALEFNIFSGGAGGTGIAYGTNGLTGASTGGPHYSSTTPLNLASGDPINISLQYLGGIISLVMTDAVAGTSFSTNITANIPAAVHTNVAYIGLTGADGATASQQEISNFFFTSLPTISVRENGDGTFQISWLSAAGSGFVLQRSTALGSSWVNVPNSISYSNGQTQVTVTPASNDEFYRLTLP